MPGRRSVIVGDALSENCFKPGNKYVCLLIPLSRPADLHEGGDSDVRIAYAYFAPNKRRTPNGFGSDDAQALAADVL